MMRSVVALVETRPETVRDDYRRVLSLAGLSAVVNNENRHLLLDMGQGRFEPGHSATPWQLAGTLGWLGAAAVGTGVMAVTGKGGGVLPPAGCWRDPLVAVGAAAAGADMLRSHRHVSGLVHPALDEVLPAGVMLPVGLAGAASLVLSAPTLRPGWVVGGSVACLAALVTRSARHAGSAPAAEITAEALAEAKNLMPQIGAVLDGAFWGLKATRTGQTCVARNVLLAGNDPVAVDAVALRLAGVDPMDVPWLRLCVQRGLGQGTGDALQVVGRRDLLGLDFDLRGDTFAAGGPSIGRGGHGIRGRRRKTDCVLETGWAALCDW